MNQPSMNQTNDSLGLLVGTSKSALIRKDETIPTPTDDYPWPSRDVGMLRGREGYAVDGPKFRCLNRKLVGGFKHVLFSIIYGMSSFPLTFTPSFFKMGTLHQQPEIK